MGTSRPASVNGSVGYSSTNSWSTSVQWLRSGLLQFLEVVSYKHALWAPALSSWRTEFGSRLNWDWTGCRTSCGQICLCCLTVNVASSVQSQSPRSKNCLIWWRIQKNISKYLDLLQKTALSPLSGEDFVCSKFRTINAFMNTQRRKFCAFSHGLHESALLTFRES